MRRKIQATGLALGLVLAATPGPHAETPAAPAEGAPRIVVARPTLDLGVVREGTTVRAVFTIENAGQKELRILRAKPS